MLSSGLASWQVSIIVNCAIFLCICLFSGLFLWKINLGGKGYKLLFITYTLFWIPLMLLRDNTGSMQKGIDDAITWLPLMAYGLVGIFARPIADLLANKTNARKTFIYVAIITQIVTYLPIIFYQSLATNIIQSLGVGIGASCIGSYQLLFNEQYSKHRHFLTISVLSIPPLLASFIASPITSIFRSIQTSSSGGYDPAILKYLWLIGLVIILVAGVMSIFIHEDQTLLFKDNSSKKEVKDKNSWSYFSLLLFLGFFIGFIKFSNSGANAILHIQRLAQNAGGSSASYEGYLSVLFSLGQLIGGLLVGLILIKYLNKLWIYSIGSLVWVGYEVLSIFVMNPYGYLGVHILNGLAYGIIYNLILGFVLQLFMKNRNVTPMGIYQAVLSLGITLSNWFVEWIKGILTNSYDYFTTMKIVNAVIISCIVLSWILYLITYQFDKRIFGTKPPKTTKSVYIK